MSENNWIKEITTNLRKVCPNCESHSKCLQVKEEGTICCFCEHDNLWDIFSRGCENCSTFIRKNYSKELSEMSK